MYPVGAAEIIELGILIWLGILSYLLYRENGFLKKLFPKGQGQDIRDKFNEVLGSLEETQKREQLLHKNLRDFAREGLRHVQKVEVLRYNPYGDTGGDQSFSIAFLDGNGKGTVLTSLHTRAGTRVYSKEIAEGKSELRLSKEEAEVVAKALQ